MKYKITIKDTLKTDIFDQETNEQTGYTWLITYDMEVPNVYNCASNYTADQTQLPEEPTLEEFEELIAGTFGYPYPPESIN